MKSHKYFNTLEEYDLWFSNHYKYLLILDKNDVDGGILIEYIQIYKQKQNRRDRKW